jgi:hypothetical protein
MPRKYGQRGYQDNDRDKDRERPRPRTEVKGPPKGAKGSGDGPRTIHMPGFQEVLRCAMCGAIVPPPVEISLESQCPKCKADLRSCKNCRNFDTGAQFECTEAIPERILRKDARNNCEFFTPRASIERETRDSSSSPKSSERSDGRSDGRSGGSSSDARNAFDNLFKK